jgi:hypothetical protein
MPRAQQEIGNKSNDLQFWISLGVALLGTMALCVSEVSKSDASSLVSAGIAALAYINVARLIMTGKAPKTSG